MSVHASKAYGFPVEKEPSVLVEVGGPDSKGFRAFVRELITSPDFKRGFVETGAIREPERWLLDLEMKDGVLVSGGFGSVDLFASAGDD